MSWHFAASTGFCVERPIIQMLGVLHDAGVTAVEVGTPPHHFDPWYHEQVADLDHHLKAWSIQPVAIHAPFGGLLDLTDPNPHHRYAAVGAILTTAAALRELGERRSSFTSATRRAQVRTSANAWRGQPRLCGCCQGPSA